MKTADVRKKYLEFFKAKGHEIIPSASLIPEGDSTTLFTGSGMQSMVPYLLGQKHPLGKRIADSQKSFRAEDIEEVGDNRHTTFFEMLGNWSLGDYWKEEQLSWLFEFLTEEIGLDPAKLYVTVFAGNEKYNIPKDVESAAIWKKLFASKKITAKEGERIYYYQDKNWWSRSGLPETMPAGEPGGPDSEIFYDFGTPHDPKYGKECHPNCDCGRFLEIGNSVFMQYQKQEDGSFKELPQRNVDFGGGLERIVAASINSSNIFEIDVLKPIIDEIRKLTVKQDWSAEQIIADHIRAATFLIADGVNPSNKDRGYIARRLIRRALTYGRKIDIKEPFTIILSSIIVKEYSQLYSELKNPNIQEEFKKEELKFRNTLEQGIKALKKIFGMIIGGFDPENPPAGMVLKNNVIVIDGKTIFDLYQSYGLPIEVSQEIMAEWGLSFHEDTIQQAKEEFKKHQELSRTASARQFKGGLASHSDKVVRLHTATHLMNAALRKVLGDHVWQKGSNITEERTRFDFTHDKKMTDEEKQEVEKLVNEWVERDLKVKKETLPLEQARKLGAIGVFGEKYPETVSVYTIWDPKTEEVISREFCGGPHVEHTGVIGLPATPASGLARRAGKFKIQKEEAVSAGVRRIKAVIE